MYYLVFFFFKQKTAYEMRISDWSSDVCSSDLDADREPDAQPNAVEEIAGRRLEHHAQLERAGDPAIFDAADLLFGKDHGGGDAQHGTREIVDHHRAPEQADNRPAEFADQRQHGAPLLISDERRAGKECVST